jgi:CheY-like chemotaxis protein
MGDLGTARMCLSLYCGGTASSLLFFEERTTGKGDIQGMSEPMRHSEQESNQEFEYCLDDIFEASKCTSDRLKRIGVTGEGKATTESSADDASESSRNVQPADRRKRRRALISAPVRVRGINVTDAVVDEISTTLDVSRAGILFLSSSPNYAQGMEVAVIFPYSSAPAALHAEQPGRVVRAIETPKGRYAVAIALGEGVGEDIVDACGRKLSNSNPSTRNESAPRASSAYSREPNSKRPLVLVVDAEETARTALKSYLSSEGYDVMATSNCADAREVLSMFTPSLVIAEVEGEGLPGYDLCAHVKANPRLKHIPVVLTTSSGYPSDYSNAHSLGAVVCMTKPYKQERLGHVVRLLAPPPAELCSQKPNSVRAADPSRRAGYGNGLQTKAQSNGTRRFRFPSFR